MVFDELEPLRNPIGFGIVDFVELGLALLLVALAVAWGRWIAPFAARFARRTLWSMAALALLPVALRLILLPLYPAPIPDIYDEFGHLLVADTLRHWRLANPPHPLHQFFETFFVLQQPTYSSIYPIGNGIALAIGWSIFGTAWAGVLLCSAALCSLCYWMLRGWTTPGWALLGGLLSVFQFGPLSQWTNSFWGGGFSAAAGCLVFGALPRLLNHRRPRDGVLLGLGLGLHLLSRPYESLFLFASVGLFFLADLKRVPWKPLLAAAVMLLPAFGITLLENKRVPGHWTTLPYTLSQYQYGVPAALTFEPNPVPHNQLTPQQDLDYRMQSNFHKGPETAESYVMRLGFRTRYYRFYFYPPLYLALFAFLITIRSYRWAWVALTVAIFALGTNFFPAFQYHYLAAVVCLFILMSVKGLERITRLRRGREAARFLIFLCVAQFMFVYGVRGPRKNPERRVAVAHEIAGTPGKLLVFVRYWPQHVFQDEWVWNGADIDSQRVVWARDLGDTENEKLIRYYRDRKLLLFEPDFRPPRLQPYEPAPPPPRQTEPSSPPNKPPLIQFESVPR